MTRPIHRAYGFQLRGCLAEAVDDLVGRVRSGQPVLLVPPPPPDPPGPGWTHHHPAPELFIQLSGTTAFTFPDGRLDLVAGGMLLMPTMLAHRESQIDRPGMYAHLVITARLPDVLGYHLHTRTRIGGKPAIVAAAAVRTPRAVLLDQLMGELVRSSHAGMAHATAARDGALLLLLATLADILAGGVDDAAEPDVRAERCERLLRMHMHEPSLSLGRLAGWLGIGADQLARSFRQATGRTPSARLAELRLQHARQLLATTALPVADVAAASGFADADYFCRVFRRALGTPPGRWRRQQGEQHRES